ncbi:hypothetical protein H6F89_00780 [Cyanobacteria bacterium FACHB-63]|nr:hypothetical protein [Cyanobacteria bacterium FACHB-63]
MVVTKRRSPTSTLVSKDSISSASSALQELPEKPKEIWSLREAIHLLKDQITIALDRGYNYSEVSQMLSSKGVEISPSTLKYYLSSARKEEGGAKTRRRRRTISMSAEALQEGSDALENAAPEQEADEKPKRTRSTAKADKTTEKASTKTAAKSKASTAKTTKTGASRKKADS